MDPGLQTVPEQLPCMGSGGVHPPLQVPPDVVDVVVFTPDVLLMLDELPVLPAPLVLDVVPLV